MGVGFNAQGTTTTDNVIINYDGHSAARSYWVSINVTASISSTTRIFFKNNGEGLYWIGTSLTFLRDYSTTDGVWTFGGLTSTSFVNAGSRFIVVTHTDGTTPKVWSDGTSYSPTATTAPVGTLVSGTNNFVLGNRSTQAQAFSWICGGFGIWNEQIPDGIAQSLSLGYSPLIWRRNLVYFNQLWTPTSKDVIASVSPTSSGVIERPHNRLFLAA